MFFQNEKRSSLKALPYIWIMGMTAQAGEIYLYNGSGWTKQSGTISGNRDAYAIGSNQTYIPDSNFTQGDLSIGYDYSEASLLPSSSIGHSD